MSTPIVEVQNVSKHFQLRHGRSVKEALMGRVRGVPAFTDFAALDQVSLDIHSGETVGLVGHNGSGKSTLLKIIGGILDPTTGTARRRGRLAALLELGAGFHPDLTGRENIFLNAAILGMSRTETAKLLDAIVDFAEIEEFLDNQVKFYSSGMYVRLGFAVAVHTDPDLLLVDEVLAVGDEPFQRKCMDRIGEFQREGRTIVVVTHSSAQVRELCNRVAVMDHGRMVYHGDSADGLERLGNLYAARRAAHGEPEHAADAPIVFGAVTAKVAQRDAGRMDVTVDIDVELRTRLDGWGVKVMFANPMGTVVSESDNFRINMDFPSGPGRYRLKYQYPAAPLAGGTFDVHVLAAPISGSPIYAHVPHVAQIEIPSAGRGDGALFMNPKITVKN